MNLKKYVIHGIGKPFNDLIVSLDLDEVNFGDTARIYRIESSSHLFESFSMPLSSGLSICVDNAKLYIDPEEIQLTDNLYGKHIKDYRLHLKDKVILVYSLFDTATTVRIEQDQTVLYAHVFLGRDERLDPSKYLQVCRSNDDASQIIFDLQEME